MTATATTTLAPMSPFEILGMDECNATPERVRSAYRLRALRTHPDKCRGNPAAAANFHKLQDAREAALQKIEQRSRHVVTADDRMSEMERRWKKKADDAREKVAAQWTRMSATSHGRPGGAASALNAAEAVVAPVAGVRKVRRPLKSRMF